MVSSTVFNQAPKYYTYDATGNLTSKTGVGSYTYGLNAGPHAVTAVDNAGVISNYHYDANGSMTSGNGRTLVYNSFNKPTQMANATADIRFSYGADRARVIRQNIVTGELRHYIGSLFERKTLQGLTNYTHYIKAGGSTVAIVNSKSDGANSTHYLHKDHLGSIAIITDENGLVIESQSYDAHGKRRNSDWSDIVGNSSPSGTTDRGFTGHEHVDEVGLIHMNGRVYDATLGRFISADPNIQAAYNSQSFNRYSYVLNNPLSYTDPSGFFFSGLKKFFKKVFRGIKNFFKSILKAKLTELFVDALLAFVGIPPGMWTYLARGFAVGLISSGGDLKAGLINALSAGSLKFDGAKEFLSSAATAIGTTVKNVTSFAHGVVQGVASVARGGKFQHGFAASIGSDIAGGVIKDLDIQSSTGRILTEAAAGGVVAELGGGKFANGAQTAAFLQASTEAAGYYKEQVGDDADIRSGENGHPEGPTYKPLPNGKQPLISKLWNVIGNNDKTSFCSQQSFCSKTLNLIPGINAVARLHDFWFNERVNGNLVLEQAAFMNIATMLPAAAISYGAIAGVATEGWQSNRYESYQKYGSGRD